MLIPNQPTISTRCGTNACLETELTDEGVRIRDTKPGGAAVVVSVAAFRLLVAALKTGELDG